MSKNLYICHSFCFNLCNQKLKFVLGLVETDEQVDIEMLNLNSQVLKDQKMKNSFINLLYSDNIRAEIQKEEILKIIDAQNKKKNNINNKEMKFKSKNNQYSEKHAGRNNRMHKSFSIKTKRSNKQPQKIDKNNKMNIGINIGININDQKTYFSVKHSYQKFIHTLKDQKVAKQLRLQLNNSPKYAKFICSKYQSSNYFQKILENRVKSPLIHRYAIIKQVRNPQQAELIQTSMNFYKYQ